MTRHSSPIACTLTAAERPARLASARELGESALVGVEVANSRAVLRFDGERDSLDAFVAAESTCCSFLAFDITDHDEQLRLEILAPPGGESVLRGLVAGVVAGWGGLG